MLQSRSNRCKVRREFVLLALAWTLPLVVLINMYSPTEHVQPFFKFIKRYIFVDFKDPLFCEVKCQVGAPCEYLDEVDFRIIVMTYNRASSVKSCLEAISKVDTLGKKIAVDIWIDRSKGPDGKIDQETLLNAVNFQQTWKTGRVCVHQREKNAYIDGQWIDTWHPKPETKEIALILEDDVDIANQTLRWLQTAHSKYDKQKDIAGYTLQMQNTRFFKGKKGALRGPKTDNVFLYAVLGTWGFSPHAESWRGFQKWFHGKNETVKPYVPGIVPTNWYQSFEKRGTQRSMWEMWHIYYSYIRKHYTVYCNLHVKTNNNNILLSFNRKEKGLHFSGKGSAPGTNWQVLLSHWKEEYGLFPEQEVRYTYEGDVVK